MTNATDPVRGNEIAMYNRDRDGDLRLVGYFPTGVLSNTEPQLGSGPAPTAQIFRLATGGALPLVSAQFDGLGSSNSLILSQDNRCLFAVNAGSNTVSSFRVRDDGLNLVSVADSRGVFPASLALDDNLLYVLNAGDAGNLAGFRVHDCALQPLHNAVVALDDFTDPTSFPIPAPNEVLTTPAQISFTPDGRRLVLSIKGLDGAAFGPNGALQSLPNGRMVVFPVHGNGRLGTAKITQFSFAAGTGGPFSFVFTGARTLVVVHANSGTIASFTIQNNNSLVLTQNQAPLAAEGFAPCWLDSNGRFVYAASFGAPSGVLEIIGQGAGLPDLNGTLTGFRVKYDGTLEPLGVTVHYPAPPVGTGNHAIDVRVIDNYLYFIQPRTGMIGRLTIRHNGALTDMVHFGGLTPGLEPFAGLNPGINNFLERCFPTGNGSPECLQGSAQGIAGF
ncbi:MAG: lactonase family protein [Candidatus Tectimicrobiota bacterium]